MPFLSRRRAALGALAASALGAPALSSEAAPVEILCGPFPPLTTDDPAKPGFVNAVALDLLRTVGRTGRITVLPWAEAQRRAREEPGRLITPLSRSAAREPHFSWLVRVLDITSSMAARGIQLDLAGARGVARLGVLRGSLHQGFLTQNGFTNLVEINTFAETHEALVQGRIDALFGNTLELRPLASAGGSPPVEIGPPVMTSHVFIASGKDTGDLPVADLQAAFAALESDGTIDGHFRTYYGTTR